MAVYVPTNWQDYPNLSTPITAARLNNIETGLSAAYVFGSGTLTNTDISAAAAIAPSKVASVLARKVTAKAVNTTIAETDLLNGEFTLAGNALGASSLLRLTIWGDWLHNEGSNRPMPRFKFKLGSTTLIDTNVLGNTAASGSARMGWRALVEVMNLGATNSQVVHLTMGLSFVGSGGTATGVVAATGEGGMVSYGTTTAANSFAEIANTTAIDTTASQAVVFSVVNGVSSASYEVKLLSALLEVSG